MRYTKIEIEGGAGNFATLTRKRFAKSIDVQIDTPGSSRRFRARADDTSDLELMTERLQEALDGFAGKASDLAGYWAALKLLTD